MIRPAYVFTILLFVFLNAKAQEPLAAYTAASFKDGILISFTLRGGFSCNGINIERSDDSLGFTVIGDIQGICGSPDEDVPFTFLDKQPLPNKKNYYRLDMKQLGYSPVMSVFFVRLNEDCILLFPNPCHGTCNFYFENQKREKATVSLFQNGSRLFTKITDSDFLEADMSDYSSGMYHLIIYYPDGRLLKRTIVKVN